MSRNKEKITKALNEKGYEIEWLHWDPIGKSVEMCGPEGGWNVLTKQGVHLLDYNITGIMKQIEKLPKVMQREESD